MEKAQERDVIDSGRFKEKTSITMCFSDYTLKFDLVHCGSHRHGKKIITSDGDGISPPFIHLDFVTINQ